MLNVKSLLYKMNTKQIENRIKDLKALIKAQAKYNDFFCGNVIDSRELQSELSIMQKPTITAIEKSQIDKPINKTFKEEGIQNEILDEQLVEEQETIQE